VRIRPDAIAFVAYVAFFVAFFAPVLFSDGFLTSGHGDGRVIALPAYLAPHGLWEPNIMLGYPVSSSLLPFWYPLWQLHALPHSFNAYVVSAYCIAAFGTYGLVATLTKSKCAGFLSGFIYALGGFMIGHLGHIDIVHPAAWVPMLMWSLVALRSTGNVRWTFVGAVSIAMCAMAGQPQVLTYALFLAVAYIIALVAWTRNSVRFVVHSLVAIGFGLALASISLLPGADLALASVRAHLPFSDFVSFSLKAGDILPHLFSAADAGRDPETANFVGRSTMALIVIAIVRWRRNAEVRFWLGAALVGLLLSTGDAFGIGILTYHVPLLNLFRAQGRHALEFTLAMAVLAGFGMATLSKSPIALRSIVVVAVVLDLTSVAWTGYWHTDPASLQSIQPPVYAARLREETARTHTRVLTLAPNTVLSPSAVFEPNLNVLWGIPEAGGYVSLLLARPGEMMKMLPSGDVQSAIYQAGSPALQLSAVRYVVMPPEASAVATLSADKQHWRRVRDTGTDVLFESRARADHAWIVHRVLASTDEEAHTAVQRLVVDLHETALIEGSKQTLLNMKSPTDRVAIDDVQADSMSLSVRCAADCFVVTSDAFFNGWHVQIDGNSGVVMRTDYALRGVFVPKGSHRVVFWYFPLTLRVGIVLSIVALLVLIALCGRGRPLWRPDREKPVSAGVKMPHHAGTNSGHFVG